MGHLAGLVTDTGPGPRPALGANREGSHPVHRSDIAVDNRTAGQVLAESYAKEITDEFLEPVRQNSVIKDGDSVLVFNFRPDRARQIVQALCLPVRGLRAQPPPELDVVTHAGRTGFTRPGRLPS